MAKPLSEDLRIRTVRAVEGGMSRRAAADRFGISVASAVRFVREWRENGATKAKRQGGDQRSQRIEEYHNAIMSAIEAKPDMTLVEIPRCSNRSLEPRLRRVRFGASLTVTA
ncbi:transposase [Bradyrhizobium sp. USDA 4472]